NNFGPLLFLPLLLLLSSAPVAVLLFPDRVLLGLAVKESRPSTDWKEEKEAIKASQLSPPSTSPNPAVWYHSLQDQNWLHRRVESIGHGHQSEARPHTPRSTASHTSLRHTPSSTHPPTLGKSCRTRRLASTLTEATS